MAFAWPSRQPICLNLTRLHRDLS